jgi:hypothetical protein
MATKLGARTGMRFSASRAGWTLFSSGGALLDLTIAEHRHHDAQLARQLWPRLQAADIILADRGFCSTLLDAQHFNAQRLAELYFRRWRVELHFRQIKILLGMDVLRCMSPAMVRKELLMHLVAYNLIRALMQRASLIYHVPLGRLSFKGTLDSLHHFADAVHAAHAKPTR